MVQIQNQIKENIVLTNDVEQYSRRLNIRIYGISLNDNESYDETVVSLIKNKLGLECDQNDIESAHPLPSRSHPSTSHSSPTKQRTSFIVRFRKNQKRIEVLKNRRKLKGTGISITEDLTSLNSQLLTRLHNHDGIQSSWSWNGQVFAIARHSGKKFAIKPYSEIDAVLAKLN